MGIEKVVRQAGLGILRQYSRTSFDLTFVSGRYLLHLQSDPISEDESMTKWNTTVGDTFISNASLNLLAVSIIPSPLSARTR
jgi:hypothetical protein